MEEIDKSAISWLHGLQEFFKFQNDEISSNYVDFILKLLYANNLTIIFLTLFTNIIEKSTILSIYKMHSVEGKFRVKFG